MKVEIKQQLSIVIPNQPGTIATVLKALADERINIGSIMFVDTVGQGVVRFTVEKAKDAQKILEGQGFFVAHAEVAEVDVPNRPGALYELTEALGKGGVNIDYAYASDNPNPNFIRDTLKLSDLKKGVEIISKL
jgi:hypothetical protein